MSPQCPQQITTFTKWCPRLDSRVATNQKEEGILRSEGSWERRKCLTQILALTAAGVKGGDVRVGVGGGRAAGGSSYV